MKHLKFNLSRLLSSIKISSSGNIEKKIFEIGGDRTLLFLFLIFVFLLKLKNKYV